MLTLLTRHCRVSAIHGGGTRVGVTDGTVHGRLAIKLVLLLKLLLVLVLFGGEHVSLIESRGRLVRVPCVRKLGRWG